MNLPYADADAMAKSHKCRCGGELVVCTDPEHHGTLWILRCGKCRATHEEAFELRKSYYRQWKEEALENPYVISRLKRMEENEMTQEIARRTDPQQAQALMQYRHLPVLSEEIAAQILETLWPKAPQHIKAHGVLLCTQLGLNPLLKHLHIWSQPNRGGGEDWIIAMSIQANQFLAKKECPYSYQDGPRMMTEKEQETIYGEAKTDRWRSITVLKVGNGLYPGYGEMKKEAKIQGEDRGNSQAHMAHIRSERQALAKLPGEQHAELLTGVDVMDAQYIETPSGTVALGTGEIIEGEAEPVEEEPLFPEDSPPAPRATAEQKTELETAADAKGALSRLHATVIKRGWTMDTLTVEQLESLTAQVKKLPDKE